MRRARAVAGFHIVVILLGLAVGAYAAWRVVGGSGQWLRIGIWFAGAVVLHDLIAFPVYAALDRALVAGGGRRVPLVNHVRAPVLGSLLLLVVFAPQIVGQGEQSFAHASGLMPGPYLTRWILVSAILFAISALAYAVRMLPRAAGASTAHQPAP